MSLDILHVDLAVVLGKTSMPLHRLLSLGRGALIELDTNGEVVEILANGHPIARGQVAVRDDRLTVDITELVRKAEIVRTPGVAIGDEAPAAPPDAALASAA